ncbi:MAG TPA: hypothetical protein VIH03_06025, partial [Nitrososphaerales archaeon]
SAGDTIENGTSGVFLSGSLKKYRIKIVTAARITDNDSKPNSAVIHARRADTPIYGRPSNAIMLFGFIILSV